MTQEDWTLFGVIIACAIALGVIGYGLYWIISYHIWLNGKTTIEPENEEDEDVLRH